MSGDVKSRLLEVCLFMYCTVVKMSPTLSFEQKSNPAMSCRVANSFVLNEVCVYNERVYADNIVSKFCFVTSYTSQHHTNFIANLTSRKKSQFRNKKMTDQIDYLQGKVQFSPFFKTLKKDTVFDKILSFWNKYDHSFNNIGSVGAKTGFRMATYLRH